MPNLIDRIEHEVALLPDTTSWCKKYTWDGKVITNKELKKNVALLASECRERYAKGGYNLLEHLYTLFPIAYRVII